MRVPICQDPNYGLYLNRLLLATATSSHVCFCSTSWDMTFVGGTWLQL